jgi:phage terminase large subunit-like protein
MTPSLADYLQAHPDAAAAIRAKLEAATDTQIENAYFDWRHIWARRKQLPPSDDRPEGPWATWVLRAGRGFGKTRTGSAWVHERALEHPGRWIAMVARTPADARDYMIEGPGGLLRNTHPAQRPLYEPSKRRLTWPNKSWATIYSDEEPDQLRGFSGDTAWIDEFCKFVHPTETWTNLAFGMREASTDRPRIAITTTPKATSILMAIERLPSTITVTGSSYENARNLDPSWFETVVKRHEGTRTGRQEIMGEILDDVVNALWTRAMLDAAQINLEGEIRVRKSAAEPPAEALPVVVGVWSGEAHG